MSLRALVHSYWKHTIVAAMLIGGLGMPVFQALAESSGRDCDSNAVMFCGAGSKAEFQKKVTSGDTKHSAANLQQIFGSRGITLSDFMSSSTVDGFVTRDGAVVVNGEVVATNALSSGRSFMTGSVRSGELWERPTSVSFRSSPLSSWVHMEGGSFKWAIVKSCGNPVRAVPKKKVTPTPTPTPTPTVTIIRTVTPTPIVTVTVLATTTVLPVTGPVSASMSGLGVLGGLGALGLASRAYVRSRRSLVDALKRRKK